MILIGLGYLAALDAWPRFLEGFADHLCVDRWCSDALFRRYAIPLGAGALVATTLAWRLAGSAPENVPWLASSVGALGATYIAFAAAPSPRTSHFVLGGCASAASAAAIWRASRGTRIGSAIAGFAAPWPFVAFALGYPTPG